MAKKEKNSMKEEVAKTEVGEQQDLIDIHPENVKEIVAAAREYKKLVAARMAVGSKEIALKQKILNLLREAKLQPLEGGKIKFKYEDVTVSVTPRDELVQVKVKDEE